MYYAKISMLKHRLCACLATALHYIRLTLKRGDKSLHEFIVGVFKLYLLHVVFHVTFAASRRGKIQTVR